MPLDRVKGEVLGNLGHDFRIVPASRWRDTAIWPVVTELAVRAFWRRNLLVRVSFSDADVLVQEYPRRTPAAVAFVFCREVGGVEKYFAHIVELSPNVLQELRLAGRWADPPPGPHPAPPLAA